MRSLKCMESIVISPFAQKLRTAMPNPKSPDPEWWRQLLKLIPPVIQIGLEGEPQLAEDFRKGMPLVTVRELISKCRTWISVDSFLPHVAHYVGKPGIVIWSRSDPNIYGYEENINILKSRDFLRKDQFGMWESETHIPQAFPDIETVAEAVLSKHVIRDSPHLSHS
jgi:ADP-heptose:LPS heptosyltransferase